MRAARGCYCVFNINWRSVKGKMRVWVRVELLCIHFDGLKVQFSEWPVSLSTFRAVLIDRAMEHFVEDSSEIFVKEELFRLRNEPSWKIAGVLHEKCRLFMQVGSDDPIEVRDLRIVQWDDDIFLSLGKWSGGYDTEVVSTDDSEDEIESWQGWLLEGEIGKSVL